MKNTYIITTTQTNGKVITNYSTDRNQAVQTATTMHQYNPGSHVVVTTAKGSVVTEFGSK